MKKLTDTVSFFYIGRAGGDAEAGFDKLRTLFLLISPGSICSACVPALTTDHIGQTTP